MCHSTPLFLFLVILPILVSIIVDVFFFSKILGPFNKFFKDS